MSRGKECSEEAQIPLLSETGKERRRIRLPYPMLSSSFTITKVGN